jgi:hypothetical protein
MLEADWAAAGDDDSTVPRVTAPGMAIMNRAATIPLLRIRIPTFMRHAPLYFQCQVTPRQPDRFPSVAPLVANFARLANALSQRIFNFIPRRCLSATPQNAA